MQLKHLKYYMTIAETGSLSEASRRLRVSQPVLSRYLAGLEGRLGLQLFERIDGSYVPTDKGRVYLKGAQEAWASYEAMLSELDELKKRASLKLSVGISPFHGGDDIANFMPPLMKRFPKLEISTIEGTSFELYELLRSGDIDISINLYEKDIMPDLDIYSLLKTELMVGIPEPMAAELGDLQTAEDGLGILDETAISFINILEFVYLDEKTLIGQTADMAARRHGLHPDIYFRNSNRLTVEKILKQGRYGSFMGRTQHMLEGMRFLHFPERVYLYSGVLVPKAAAPNETIAWIYYHLLQMDMEGPDRDQVHINKRGKELLARYGISMEGLT